LFLKLILSRASAAKHLADAPVQDSETDKAAAEAVHENVPPVWLIGVRSALSHQQSEVKRGSERNQGQEEPEAADNPRGAALDELGPAIRIGAFVFTSNAILNNIPGSEHAVDDAKEYEPCFENAVAKRLRVRIKIDGQAPDDEADEDTKVHDAKQGKGQTELFLLSEDRITKAQKEEEAQDEGDCQRSDLAAAHNCDCTGPSGTTEVSGGQNPELCVCAHAFHVAQTTLIRVNLNAGDLTAEEPNHGGVAKFMQEGCKTFPRKDDSAVPEDEHERKQARKLRLLFETKNQINHLELKTTLYTSYNVESVKF
jgi:hypothetical protein